MNGDAAEMDKMRKIMFFKDKREPHFKSQVGA